MKYDKKEARMEMLKELKKAMMDEDDMGLGGKLGDMKKVTVMSDTKEGLEKGLSKAQEIMEARKKAMGEMEDDEEEELEDEE